MEKTGLAAIVSGDNTTGHVFAASAVGQAVADLILYGLAAVHAPPPPQYAVAVLATVVVSWIAQKVGA